jgi:hypothetical protein
LNGGKIDVDFPQKYLATKIVEWWRCKSGGFFHRNIWLLKLLNGGEIVMMYFPQKYPATKTVEWWSKPKISKPLANKYK